MILVGNRRGGGADLARHLMNVEDNEHVHIHQIRGFVGDDLHDAFHEAYGISRGTRCRKFLYSLILSPPEAENVPVDTFEAAIEKIERKLGFTGQPRAIVFHEKKGRRHAHCVWSRIDADRMRAIDPYQDKLTLESLARELFQIHGWTMPPGLKRKEDTDPLNYSHAQDQQAKRAGRDPKELKRIFSECWAGSDSKSAFAYALKERGLILAKGDRRGHVAVNADGEVYAISRWVGVKAKDVRARLGDSDDLPSVEEALGQFAPQIDREPTARNRLVDIHRSHATQALERRRLALVTRHRQARGDLQQQHQDRRIAETKTRAAKLPGGLKSAWLKLSGRYQAIVTENEADAGRRDEREKAEQQLLIVTQLRERRTLQQEIIGLHQQYCSDGGPDVAARLLKLDPAQELILPVDPETLTIGDKVRRDPVHILQVITDKREFFTRNDILRGLAEHIDDPLMLRTALNKVMQAAELVEIGGNTNSQYTTGEMQALKSTLAVQVKMLSQSAGASVGTHHIHAAIEAQNRQLQRAVDSTLSRQQETAILHCLGPQKLGLVVGLAGAGKSTMLCAAREAWESEGYRVTGAALAGKAADSLESASGIESRTLTSLMRSWSKGYHRLTPKDVLVIDEAGMIGTRQLARIVQEVQSTGAKLVLVGDPEQLQPINAGTPFKDIGQGIEPVHLTEIHRQKIDWQKQASLDLAERRTGRALDAYEVHGRLKPAFDNTNAILSLVEDYMADLSLNGDQNSRLALAHRRKDVHAINQSIRKARQSGGELSNETLIKTDHGPRAFAKDDRVLFTANDHTLGLRNGMLGTVQHIEDDQLIVRLDDTGVGAKHTITINPKHYTALDHGYATTIHKSQGATVDRAFVLGGTTMDRHLTYVAMTRHKHDVTLYADRNTLKKMRNGSAPEYSRQRQPHRPYRRRPHGPTMH